MSSERARSAICQTDRQPPIPPTIPYISLPDRHLSNYFTKERIRKHLLQAGLLTKDGRIVTEAEYASKQTDIAVGRDNRRKRDEAIFEVLRELGVKQHKLANNLLEEIKGDLQYQFQRIEKQYSRRTQPITIKVTHESQVEQLPIIAPKASDQNQTKSNATTNRSRFPSFSVSARFSNELENIRKKLDELTRKQSMLELKWNTPRTFAKSSNEPENFRNKLDELTHNQSTLEKTLNTLRMSNSSNVHLWRIQQTVNQLKENQENIEKQQKISQQTHENEEKRGIQGSEQLIHMSTDIKDLYESIKNIHKSLAAKPSGLTQTDMDAAIASSERRIIEQIDQKVDVKFHQLEAQIAALKAFPTPMTRTDVENLIANAMQIIKPNEVKKEDSGTLNRAVNDRISRLEKQLDDLPKLISSYVTRPTVDDLIRDAISNRQVVIAPHSDSSLQNRIAFLEERSSTFLLVKDLDQIKQRLDQLEIRPAPLGRPDPLSSVVQPIPAHTTYLEDPRITSLQKQVDDHMRFLNQFGEQINILMRMKIDHSGVNQLVNASEEKTTQAVNELAKYVHRECQDPRLPGVINQLNSYSTLIQNLTNQINDLDRNKPDLKIIEKLIQDRMKQMKDKSAPSVSCNEQYDPRITDLQTQIIDQLEFIRNLEKQFERLQQFVDESERRTQASIGNLSSPMNQDLRDSKLSNILQQVHIHTNAIQDLDSRINQLPKIQPNDELREKIDDVEHEAKRAHTDLAALRRQLAQQPTSIFPSAGKVSLPKQYTAKDYQAIMPFIEVLPTFNLFAENEWD